MPDLSVLQGIRWYWVDWLDPEWGALYSTPPPRICRVKEWWETHGRCESRVKLADEIGHHLSGHTYPWNVPKVQREWIEAKSRRRGAAWLIDDALVMKTLRAGWQTPQELSWRWEVTEDWAARRLEQFLAKHPGWRP